MEFARSDDVTLWQDLQQVKCAILAGVDRLTRLFIHEDLGCLIEYCQIVIAHLCDLFGRNIELWEVLGDLENFSDARK